MLLSFEAPGLQPLDRAEAGECGRDPGVDLLSADGDHRRAAQELRHRGDARPNRRRFFWVTDALLKAAVRVRWVWCLQAALRSLVATCPAGQ